MVTKEQVTKVREWITNNKDDKPYSAAQPGARWEKLLPAMANEFISEAELEEALNVLFEEGIVVEVALGIFRPVS